MPRISEMKTIIASVMKYNLEQFERGASHNTYVIPYIEGDPGLGKTACGKQVAEEYGIPYRQTIIAQYDAGEMAGLPFKSTVTVDYGNAFNSIEDAQAAAVQNLLHNSQVVEDGKTFRLLHHVDRMTRLRPNYLPDDEIAIYNLDELPQAFLANQNIASQLVNEYRVGEHEISPGITMIGTGNKAENKAGTTAMPAHLKDRLTFFTLEANLDDFLNYASANGLDTRIRAYLRQNAGRLHDFKPGTKANPTPRSWEKVSAWLSMGLPPHLRTQALSGQIGDADAIQFETWIRVEDKLPKIEDIINDPENAPLFTNKQADVLYLLLTNLADAATNNNVEQILKYIKRLPNQEFAAFWAQDTFSRDRSLLEHKAVQKWKISHGANLLY